MKNWEQGLQREHIIFNQIFDHELQHHVNNGTWQLRGINFIQSLYQNQRSLAPTGISENNLGLSNKVPNYGT
ncbi:hypothetical protein MTR_4g077717 [Medicago truncatula]|uniref:Uncharacterized protein n=1 Tax=Medicago truncatula TaxID=3880 RepID=A0A072ULS2_MEDTR|nr:hypothetical protein MTR_4g077717 [Medicago truncatula]